MDKSRKQFEVWFKNRHEVAIKDFDKKMVNLAKEKYLEVWQASRESLEIELPRKHDVDDEYDYFAMGYNLALNKIHDLLVEEGVKVK